MRVVVVGASGTIGREIVRMLSPRHEIVEVGSRSGAVRVDYTDKGSIHALFETVGAFDSLVCVVGGDSVFKRYAELTEEDFEVGFRRKFLAQYNLVRIGSELINDGGSFTLSSGFLSHFPSEASVATGPWNAAVDSLVTSVAPLLGRSVRLNVVSPAPVVPSDRVGKGLISAEQAAQSYVRCVEGDFTGRIIREWGGLELAPG